MPAIELLIGFHLFILAMLALDLGVFQRKAHKVSIREAAAWTIVWGTLAMLFAAGIWQFWDHIFPEKPGLGTDKAIEFVTGYVVEISLSVDNLFVFLVIFRYFGVPEHLRHRVLFWGILGAVIMRATFILLGGALLAAFHWMIYVFGVILIWTAIKLLRSGDEEVDVEKNFLLRLARRYLPVVNNYDSPTFWVYREEKNGEARPDDGAGESTTATPGKKGRWYATPLPLVLLVVESTDVVFAVDSIPAIFGITRDIFIVYTSNIFAVLGLRAMYFLLAGVLSMFRYLKIGLSFVLMFVGLKMLTEGYLPLKEWGIGQTEKILISLGMIVFILATSVVASLIAGPAEEHHEEPAEEPRAEAEEAQPRFSEES
ncbi:MAG: TerC family protein [Gemmataceae bacterium]